MNNSGELEPGDVRSPSIEFLKEMSKKIRAKVVEMSHKGDAPHLASSLSCVDILTVLYWKFLTVDPTHPDSPTRDRFIMSKGHAAAAFYATLAHKGFFPLNLLETYVQNGGRLAEHPGPACVPGVEAATGSLGHGLSIGLGMALAAKIMKHQLKVVALLSDGECNEGSVWEAALFAAGKKLDNVIALVDYNKWQATGRSNEVLALHPLAEKWKSFGWDTYEVNGNDIEMLVKTLETVWTSRGKPVMIICHTIKGKGISFMEDDNNWHYRIPTWDEVEKAQQELINI